MARLSSSLASLLLVTATVPLLLPAGQAGLGHHINAETPGSNQVFVFSTFGTANGAEAFMSEVEPFGYTIVRMIDDDGADNLPKGATAGAFASTSGRAGILYINTHGASDGLLVEKYSTEAFRTAAFDAYTTGPNPRFNNGGPFPELVPCNAEGGTILGLCITDYWILHHWTDAHTLVFAGACHSWDLMEEFGVQEFFGYDESCLISVWPGDTGLLFGRMHGALGDGQYRAASRAYNEGGFSSANFRYHHLTGRPATVLAPAVSNHGPDAVAWVPGPQPLLTGFVSFDSTMDTTAPPTIEQDPVAGPCIDIDATTIHWTSPREVQFQFQLTGVGASVIRVQAATTRSQGINKPLDGNTQSDAPLRDHVGPNGDDFIWDIVCSRAGVQANDAITRSFNARVVSEIEFKDPGLGIRSPDSPCPVVLLGIRGVNSDFVYYQSGREATNSKLGSIELPTAQPPTILTTDPCPVPGASPASPLMMSVPDSNFYAPYEGISIDQLLCAQGNGPLLVTCVPDPATGLATLARCDHDDATFTPSPNDGKSALANLAGSRSINCAGEGYQDAVTYYSGSPTGYVDDWFFEPGDWGTDFSLIQNEDVVPLGNGIDDSGYIVVCMDIDLLVTDPNVAGAPYIMSFQTHDYQLVLDLDGSPESWAAARQKHAANNLQGWHDLGGKNGFPCPPGVPPPDKKGDFPILPTPHSVKD